MYLACLTSNKSIIKSRILEDPSPNPKRSSYQMSSCPIYPHSIAIELPTMVRLKGQGRGRTALSSGPLACRPSFCVCNKQRFLGHSIQLFFSASGTSLCEVSSFVLPYLACFCFCCMRLDANRRRFAWTYLLNSIPLSLENFGGRH